MSCCRGPRISMGLETESAPPPEILEKSNKILSKVDFLYQFHYLNLWHGGYVLPGIGYVAAIHVT